MPQLVLVAFSIIMWLPRIRNFCVKIINFLFLCMCVAIHFLLIHLLLWFGQAQYYYTTHDAKMLNNRKKLQGYDYFNEMTHDVQKYFML